MAITFRSRRGLEQRLVDLLGQQAQQALGLRGALAQVLRRGREVAGPDVDVVRVGEPVEGVADEAAGDEHAGHLPIVARQRRWVPSARMTKRFLRTAGVLSVVAMAGLALAVAALAATKHGVTPLAPAAGSTVPQGKSPTFKVQGQGQGLRLRLRLQVQEARLQGPDLQRRDDRAGAKKKSAAASRSRRGSSTTPSFWLNTPGTYYWQAHRIRCEGGSTTDCSQEGPVVKFKVG